VTSEPVNAEWLADALAAATVELTEAGCDSPRLDAELLLSEVIGVDRARLVLDAREPITVAASIRFAELVARRMRREPVAYIVGHRGFRYLELRCDARALIPRPETELLVEVGLTLEPGSRVLDVGTGSGAVALALKHERPDLLVSATDSSDDALALARENAAELGLEVEFVHADLRGSLGCDALLANLPYVETEAELAPEITGYEPVEALYAGTDGLDAIRRLCAQLDGVATVALEHGSAQGKAVAALLRDAGFPSVSGLRDLAGHDRVTVGRQ
jgi:release factor glutamine methyltransferase